MTSRAARRGVERYVALLRGINVGRAKRVAMADLRAIVADLGYSEVRTLLNSGNVVFAGPSGDPRAIAERIQALVEARTGVSSRTLVLSASELGVVVRENPLLDVATEPSRLLAAMYFDVDDGPRLQPLAARDWTPDALAIGSRAAYLWCPAGIAASELPDAVYRGASDVLTMRNWSTILKLHALATA